MGSLRRHGWWLIPELLAIGLVAALIVADRSNAFNNQLSDRVELVLEQSTPEQHHQHGHQFKQGERVLCAAEAFGTEPPGAKRIEDVRVVYALYICASATKGTPWDYASRSAGPAKVTLADPPTVEIPVSGAGYPERVRALIPDNLEKRAFGSFVDKGRPAALRHQYEAELA